jgi:hypothetical protein
MRGAVLGELADHQAIRGFQVASSYGRGIRSSTNGGFDQSVSNPGKLLWEGEHGSGEIAPGCSANQK